MKALLCCYWTEHEDLDTPGWERRAPHSAEVSGIAPFQTILMPCGETPSAFVLRWVGTEEECKAALDATHEQGWDLWLSLWEERKRVEASDTSEFLKVVALEGLDAQLLKRSK